MHVRNRFIEEVAQIPARRFSISIIILSVMFVYQMFEMFLELIFDNNVAELLESFEAIPSLSFINRIIIANV